MKRLAHQVQRAPQWAQGEAEPTRIARAACGQRNGPVLTVSACGQTEDVGGGYPVAACDSRVADYKPTLASAIPAHDPVQSQAAVQTIEHKAAQLEGPGWRGHNLDHIAITQGGIHAGAAGAKSDWRALFEKQCDDIGRGQHETGHFQKKKVVQPMNKTNPVLWLARWSAVAMMLAWAGPAAGALPTGEAVVASMTGKATVRVFTGPVHEGATTVRDLFEGAAVGEHSRVMTGRDGQLCMVCSPGAIICVAPQTELTFRQLRHTADGLPKSNEDLIRRIHIQLHRGRVRVQAGAPSPMLDIQVETAAGAVEAQGAAFVVAQRGKENWDVYCDDFELSVISRNGERAEIEAGGAASLFFSAEQERAELQTEQVAIHPELHTFELCNVYFADLEPFLDHIQGLDRTGLGRYLGLTTPFYQMDGGAIVTDASPIVRPTVSVELPAALPRPAEGQPGGRWGQERLWNWYNRLGPIKGVNYVPRTAVNAIEMWCKDTFDADTMDEELGWAGKAGYTAIRVQLSFEVWQNDPDGFLDRLDKLLSLANKHGQRVVPVLFDDLDMAGQAPVVGPQPDPVPGEHNSRWVPSPAHSAVADREQWPELEKYVKEVMRKFRRDGRVLYWDLYNTAGNSGLGEESLPLMDQTFNWARSVEASQPLAVSAWHDFGGAMTARKLERSDLITFQGFDHVESVEARLKLLQRHQRPIICSDWLMRQTGNDFDNMLPLFSVYRVGWFNRGLVAGKTQLEIQQPQYRSDQEPDLWQQNVLKADGEPYNEREVELIQGFRFLEGNR